jgi:hypothetical protein
MNLNFTRWVSAPFIFPIFSIITSLMSQALVANNHRHEGFDWNGVMNMPPLPAENKIPSPQVLHFYPYGKSVGDHEATANYIQEHMQKARVFESDADHLRYAVDSVTLDGLILEFGVCTGKSVNFIAALKPRSTVYGFDSFEGLPKDWEERNIGKGTFGFTDKSFRPPILNNVRLYAGLFEEILPGFLDTVAKDLPIALIHIDADLYESTKTIFNHLGSHIRPGTILVFDEYFNYTGWENHEHKAFQEFMVSSGFAYEYISYNCLHEQVAVRILIHP